MTETTYDNFCTLVQHRNLTRGEEYRITDYVTSVRNDYVPDYMNGMENIICFRSAGHQFDIVVTATTDGTFNHWANVMVHSGDTYFTAEQVAQWSVYYEIDILAGGGTSRVLQGIPWAQSRADGGKGIILWMRDEHGNEAYYDFKNIQFLRKQIIGAPALRTDIEVPAAVQDFYTKVKSAYDAAGYTGANKGMSYHIWSGYLTEHDCYVDLYTGQPWGDYILEEDGTRIFCAIDEYDGQECYIIAQVSDTDMWFYTFSNMQGSTITDASLDGTASNCRIKTKNIELTDVELGDTSDYDLPESVMILTGTETANKAFAYSEVFYNNTIAGSIEGCEIDGNTRSTLFNNGWGGAVTAAEYFYTISKQTFLPAFITGSNRYDILEDDYKVVVKTLTFESFDNKTYTIDIYGTSEESAIGNMTLESSAVNIQENSDNDFFKALRTQTGYMHLTNATVTTLLQLIPLKNMQRPLVIKENGTVIWTGFMKPQQFNMQFTAMMYEKVNLPIACQLSMIKGEYFKPNINTQYMSIGRIILLTIATIASNIPEPIKDICFDYGEQMIGNTQYVTGSDAWLQASISPAMFYKYKEDIPEAKIDMQKMMESLCTFLGFTCRTEGSTLYFMAMDDSSRGRNMRKVTYQQLFGIVNGIYVTGSAVATTQKNIFGTSDHINRYAGIDNSMLMKEGVNKAVVNCEKQEHSLTFEWPESEVANDFPTTSPSTIYDQITDASINVFAQREKYKKETDNAIYEIDYGSGSWYLLVYDPNTETIGNLYPKATVRCNSANNNRYAEKILTKSNYTFNNCIISVNLSAAFSDTPTYARARIYVKIGNQFYKEASVSIVDGSVPTNRQKYSGDANYDGYGFKIDSSTITNGNAFLYGQLEVGILSVTAYYYNGSTRVYPAVEISGFTVQIVPNERLGVKYQEQYEVEAQGSGSDYTKSTMFINGTETSHLDNAVIGVDKFLSSTETDNNYNSCEYFAQRMANYYKRARRLFKLVVKRSMVNAKPTDIFVDSPDGAKYTPISIENDFRDDVQKLVLAEIDN